MADRETTNNTRDVAHQADRAAQSVKDPARRAEAMALAQKMAEKSKAVERENARNRDRGRDFGR